MPYIEPDQRKKLDIWIDCLLRAIDVTKPIDLIAKDFTYVVYRLLRRVFFGRFWIRAIGIGCMVCVILEWYRRDCSRLEDQAIEKNGDIL